jgi:hypothetical protein
LARKRCFPYRAAWASACASSLGSVETTSTGMPAVSASASSCSSRSHPASYPMAMSTIRASGFKASI